MPDTTERHEDGRAPLWRRLLWFGLLWLGGVAAVGAVAFAIRLVLKP